MTSQSLAPEECGDKVMRQGNRVLGHSWVMAKTQVVEAKRSVRHRPITSRLCLLY